VGPIRAELLRIELDLATYEQLLNYFPYRYFDRTNITKIGTINASMETVQVAGTLINMIEEGSGRRNRLTATLYDETGRIELVWFQAISWAKKNLKEGTKYLVFGKLNLFNGFFNIAHPEIELLQADNSPQGLQPVYSTTEKLRIRVSITNRSFSKITAALFEKIKATDVPEYLPESILQEHQLCGRFEAYKQIHFPENTYEEQRARYRLKWEELFISQLLIGKLRLQHQRTIGFKFTTVGHYFNTFYNQYLPFQLTNAQKRVIKEIRQDTANGRQMNRLLQGDVGSGKTIVALMSMLIAIDNDFQACIMAPTEILAYQHYSSISGLLNQLGIEVRLLTGSVKGKARKEILSQLKDGTLPIVVGTHALIEETVIFRNLGLAVIDEQHRFGVGQRAQLWKKNILPPHVLVMTATPIPRTLAMTMYGDLDVSVIDELPPGRQEIKTVHRKDTNRMAVMHFIKKEIEAGRQAYIVYPLIDESEKLEYESLMAGYEQVKSWFSEDKYKIAMVHGKQDPELKAANMKRFVSGEAHILVATTVIEVGVNVPNATVMLIESAERFGLSQMHQLRGRVGRGGNQSYCILMTGNGLSDEGYKRIQIMVSTANGFEIAEKDLELRGPGDLYGTKQSGVLKFKLADIVQDKGILEITRQAAQRILEVDPQLDYPHHAPLKNKLLHQSSQGHWGKIS